MSDTTCRRLTPVPLTQVSIESAFWAPRLRTNRDVTLPIEYQQCKYTGRIDAWKLDWTPESGTEEPHIFWDSDIAKWIEAVGYAVAIERDPELEALVDGVVDLMEAAQQPDGYLNIHFTAVEPELRWSNLRDWHELYCAGHLMEGAVAYYEGTGKRKLLDVLCRYADYIDTVFGPGDDQLPGYPGHEEIELGLVKLYRATGNERYLNLAKFFVDERGQQPHYFDIEAQRRGKALPAHYGDNHDYNQSHLPVREQETAEGHAVRAMYLYSGMADVAGETGDPTLLAACETLWDNVTKKRMYLIGGIGSAPHGERFSVDYDLPNDDGYLETCAAIGLVFWAQRMLQYDGDSRYADVMERALYNGCLSGISLSGDRFFYGNPLEVDLDARRGQPQHYRGTSMAPVRQEWFGCACCPPNIARLLASVGSYVYSTSDDALYVHLFIAGETKVEIGGQSVSVEQVTEYPWQGHVKLVVTPETAATFALALRKPDWCRVAELRINGKTVEPDTMRKGYAMVTREWQPGDVVHWMMEMPIERMRANPAVRHDAGRVALQRGPLVYCLEELDNGPNMADLILPADAPLTVRWRGDLLGGVMVVEGDMLRRDSLAWEGALYQMDPSPLVVAPFTAISYYAGANRELGNMIVWVREG